MFVCVCACAHVSVFLQHLCAKGAWLLNTKSMSVEEAVNELITMLCLHHGPEDQEDSPYSSIDHDEEVEGKLTAGSCV